MNLQLKIIKFQHYRSSQKFRIAIDYFRKFETFNYTQENQGARLHYDGVFDALK